MPLPHLPITLHSPLPFGLLGFLLSRLFARAYLGVWRRRSDLCFLPAGRLLIRLIGRTVRRGRWLRQQARDGLDLAAVALEEASEHLADVLEQVPAVGHLHGIGRGFGAGPGVGAGVVAADDLDAWVVSQPLIQGRAVTAGQQVDDPATFRSTRMVPWLWPLRMAQSSTPSTRGVGACSVAVCLMPSCRARREPGSAPKARAMAR
jgi:hypothetical protein